MATVTSSQGALVIINHGIYEIISSYIMQIYPEHTNALNPSMYKNKRLSLQSLGWSDQMMEAPHAGCL